MTKAERRELQEKQRAAKVAKPGAAAPSASSAPVKPPPTPASAAPGRKSGSTSRNSDAGLIKSSQVKDSGSVHTGEEGGTGKSRGLRIFSHFGLPSRAVSHVVKGDIHPSIVRLGLQFSEFKISGANARCIATLTAFKTVRFCLILRTL
jgi:translation initiation factor eIF-2B subunit delta